MQDTNTGYQWLIRAAELGDAEAHIRLADYFEAGFFGQEDCEKAAYWISKAKLIDSFYGHYAFAMAHQFGTACFLKNEFVAVQAYESAASYGHIISMAQLAKYYRSGKYGLRKTIVGYFLLAKILVFSLRAILRREMHDAFWGHEQWLPNNTLIKRLSSGTHFGQTNLRQRDQ